MGFGKFVKRRISTLRRNAFSDELRKRLDELKSELPGIKDPDLLAKKRAQIGKLEEVTRSPSEFV
ncbi:MAG TPA: hypothetical protein VF189_01605 [Patescibacteria group bacterium]